MSPLRRHLRPDFWCQDAPGCRSKPRPPVHHDWKNRFESSYPYSLYYRDVPGLFLAVENGHQAIAETLICYGANLTTPTYSGATPASLCTFSDSR